ncbi:MAG: hypothetical protein A2044_05800 [Candidatus Firestonebacteria bacterium GWA2_43_8]|nr:MAG: hypothetical protein A2044_05800 [Candidatus Firestonebacteria bacterium GWA2_43_8]
MKKLFNVSAVIVFSLIAATVVFAEEKEKKTETSLFNFENSSDINSFESFSGQMVAEHAKKGAQSCKVSFTANQKQSLAIKEEGLTVKDWSGYKELKFDVYSNFNEDVQLQVKFVSDGGAQGERSIFIYKKVPSKKDHTVTIKLKSIEKDENGADFEVSKMIRFRINCTPSTDGEIYFDNIRLE